MKFEDICEIACTNFDNINKKYTKDIKSNGYNFNTMKEEDKSLYNSVFVKTYYNEEELVRIEVIDTLNIGRNFDIDIIFKSDSFYIGTIFFWNDIEKKQGVFSSGFIINDRVNLKSYLVEREHINFVLTENDSENVKDKFPFKSKTDHFLQFVSSIKVLDKKLFVKYNVEFEYRRFISYSKYVYTENKINEFKYIIKDNDFPYFFLEKFSIEKIYKLFTIALINYNYEKKINDLKKPIIYYQDKPLWIFE